MNIKGHEIDTTDDLRRCFEEVLVSIHRKGEEACRRHLEKVLTDEDYDPDSDEYEDAAIMILQCKNSNTYAELYLRQLLDNEYLWDGHLCRMELIGMFDKCMEGCGDGEFPFLYDEILITRYQNEPWWNERYYRKGYEEG